jgi:lysophospholipase L1-like esterase
MPASMGQGGQGMKEIFSHLQSVPSFHHSAMTRLLTAPFRHFLLFLLLATLGASQALAQTPPEQARTNALKFTKEIVAYEESDKTNAPPKHGIIFIGSSSIRRWTNLVTDFPKHPVINRGFGGSQICDSVTYAERLVFPHEPDQIIFYAGGNDIHAGKKPDMVFADFKAFVAKVHQKLPKTHIDFISIAPNPARWSEMDDVKALNKMVEDFTKTDKRLGFINVYPHMLGEDGMPKDIYVADRLHMNPKGYEIWKGIVEPRLLK